MFLTDNQIRRSIRKKEMVIKPFKTNNLKGSSYDVSLGRVIAINPTLDSSFSSEKAQEVIDFEETKKIIIKKGDFYLVMTEEKFKIPKNMNAIIGSPAYLANFGVNIHHGISIDPDYEGPLTFGISISSDINIFLKKGQRIATIMFSQLNEPAKKNYTPDPNPWEKIIFQIKMGKKISPKDLNEIRREITETFISSRGSVSKLSQEYIQKIDDVINIINTRNMSIDEIRKLLKNIKRDYYTQMNI